MEEVPALDLDSTLCHIFCLACDDHVLGQLTPRQRDRWECLDDLLTLQDQRHDLGQRRNLDENATRGCFWDGHRGRRSRKSAVEILWIRDKGEHVLDEKVVELLKVLSFRDKESASRGVSGRFDDDTRSIGWKERVDSAEELAVVEEFLSL